MIHHTPYTIHSLSLCFRKEAFADCNFEVRYKRIIATINNLRSIITAGTKILHYCGHGIPKSLIFESEQQQYAGMSKQVRPEHLRQLINAGRNQQMQSPLRLVFVSACHSEDAGKAFVKAGAAHVVAVRRSEELHDDAAATFTAQFYFALVTGKTVQQAFDIANQTIATQFGDDNFIKNESQKYILLPKAKRNTPGIHDEILFPPLSPRQIQININSYMHTVLYIHHTYCTYIKMVFDCWMRHWNYLQRSSPLHQMNGSLASKTCTT